MRSSVLSLLWIAVLLTGCSSEPAAPANPPESSSTSAAASAEPQSSLPRYTLVWIRTGPKSGTLSDEENRELFAGHFANMERLAQERKLLLAGPFGKQRSASDLRGLFVLDTTDGDEARAWASTDPTAQAGVFVLEYQELATDMPLAAMLEEELARLEARRASGEARAPGDGVRAWALLTAEHGDLARRELAPLVSPDGGVFLLGELAHGRAWAILDARDAAEAAERFAPELAAIGAHTLDDWFATDLIATLVR
jgi:uncharacterized protein YciI